MSGETNISGLKFFFVTYGNNLLGAYSVIRAETYADARRIAFAGTDNGKFAFIYEGEEELERQNALGYFPHGEVELQPMQL